MPLLDIYHELRYESYLSKNVSTPCRAVRVPPQVETPCYIPHCIWTILLVQSVKTSTNGTLSGRARVSYGALHISEGPQATPCQLIDNHRLLQNIDVRLITALTRCDAFALLKLGLTHQTLSAGRLTLRPWMQRRKAVSPATGLGGMLPREWPLPQRPSLWSVHR